MVQFEEFVIGEMFEIATGRDIIIGNTTTGNIPLVSHQNSNNGIVKYISPLPSRRLFNHNTTIALADRGLFYATVQTQDFHIGTRVKALTLKGDIQKREVLMYLAAAINKLQTLFTEYLVNATDKLPSLTIKLPICIESDGKIKYDRFKTFSQKGYVPDFKYMQERIAKLEQERITELEQCLFSAGLDDYRLTKEENQILTHLPINKEFGIIDIFDVKNSHCILKSDVSFKSGKFPYITASKENNGVMGYINNESSMLEHGNCIFIGGKTMTINYQEYDFFSNDSHNLILTLKDQDKRTKGIQLFMVTALYKSLSPKYIWNDSISFKKIQKDSFYLPIKIDDKTNPVRDIQCRYHKNGFIPDFDYMEKYICAIQKKVITDVVKYKDNLIKNTKKL